MGQQLFSSTIPAVSHAERQEEDLPLVPPFEPPPFTPPPCLTFQECETPPSRTFRPSSPELPWMTRDDTPPPLLVGLLTPNDPLAAPSEEMEEAFSEQSFSEDSVTPPFPQRRDIEAASNISSIYELPGPDPPQRTRVIHRGPTRPSEILEGCVCTWETQNLLLMMTRIIDLKPEVMTAIAPTSAKSFQMTEWISLVPALKPDEVVRTKVSYDFTAQITLIDARTAVHVGHNMRPLPESFRISFLENSYRVTHQTDLWFLHQDRQMRKISIPIVRDLRAHSAGYKLLVPPNLMFSQDIPPRDLHCPPGEITIFVGMDHFADMLPVEVYKDLPSRIVIYRSRITGRRLVLGAINMLAASLNAGAGDTIHRIRPGQVNLQDAAATIQDLQSIAPQWVKDLPIGNTPFNFRNFFFIFPIERSGDCFTAAVLSSISGSSRPNLIPGVTELRSGSERLNRQLATSAFTLLRENSSIRRKLLHICHLSAEDLPTVVRPHLERLYAGAGDSQLWRHGQGGGASMGLGVRHSLEDLVVMITAYSLQRDLLIFHVRPACAVIVRCKWLGIESTGPPVTVLYDRSQDHFTALIPQWEELKDLGEFILRDALPQSIFIPPSELEIRLSRYLTYKGRS